MTNPDPSGSLHTKLQTIDIGNESYQTLSDEQVAQILQALQEEGYISPEMVDEIGKQQLDFGHRWGMMTGSEWFSRFKAELDSGLALPEPMRLWVVKCAEVAAGVSDE